MILFADPEKKLKSYLFLDVEYYFNYNIVLVIIRNIYLLIEKFKDMIILCSQNHKIFRYFSNSGSEIFIYILYNNHTWFISPLHT